MITFSSTASASAKFASGIIERQLKFHWGCEGRVDAVAVDQLPIMKKANCNFLAFGVEAGTQKVLDRLHKKQTLKQVEHAVSEAKRHGIERVHGFFVIGSPGETKEDIMASFRFAARLKLDTFGFNRLCAYRGTPLWQEYVDRGIIDDERDWDKWFKCSDIDPTALPSAAVNRLRMKGYALLFARRIFRRPIRTYKLLRTLRPPYEDVRYLQIALQSFSTADLEPEARSPGQDDGVRTQRARQEHCLPSMTRIVSIPF